MAADAVTAAANAATATAAASTSTAQNTAAQSAKTAAEAAEAAAAASALSVDAANLLTKAGNLSGIASVATARTNLDVPSNADLNAATADIASLLAALQIVPQGYLTLVSGQPVINTDQVAATSVYYTPLTGNLVPIYDGTNVNMLPFSELTLTLNAAHLAGLIYDLFVINDSGTLRLATGPAWTTSTSGAGARGTGAGTAELELVHGRPANKNSMAARNGGTTYTVPAGQGLQVGIMRVAGANGTVTCHVTSGQAREWGIWNTYNRRRITLQVTDPTTSWTYNSATVRQSHADGNNFLRALTGLAEEQVDVTLTQRLGVSSAGGGNTAQIGIGINSASVTSGQIATVSISASGSLQSTVTATAVVLPTIGSTDIYPLESSPTATSDDFYGGVNMRLKAVWNG
jgi:hypothetical protein